MKIVRRISMIVWQTWQIHAKTVALVLIWSMVTSVCAKLHIPAEIVTIKWIRAIRISVTMAQNAHRFRTIKISHAAARSATLDACVIKTSTSAHSRHRAAMELLARIFPAHTSACVPMAMKDATVPLTRMIVRIVFAAYFLNKT